MQYEYKVFVPMKHRKQTDPDGLSYDCPAGMESSEIEDELNKLGEEGWKALSWIPNPRDAERDVHGLPVGDGGILLMKERPD